MTSPRTGWSCWSLTITGRALPPVDLQVDQRGAVHEHLAQHAVVDLERRAVAVACRRRPRRARRPSRRRRRTARVPRSGRSSTASVGRLESAIRRGQCSGGSRADLCSRRVPGATRRQLDSRRDASAGRPRWARCSARRARATPAPAPRTSRARPEAAAEALDARHLEAAERMVETLGRMKGAAMKIGQLASFIDTEFLPARVPRALPGAARLAAHLGAADAVEEGRAGARARSGTSRWRSCSRTSSTRPPRRPRSARCTARRCRDGREVAVKIQYPGVAEAIRADMQNAGLIMRMAKALAPGLDAKAAAEELKERVLEELDYELEAQNQRAFARGYRDHPFIYVPDVVTRLSTTRVLVTRVGRRRGLRRGGGAARRTSATASARSSSASASARSTTCSTSTPTPTRATTC